MAYLLHIDTSGDTGIVALNHNGQLLGSISNADTRNHAATINLHVEQVLQDAGITLQQLNAVVVCGGPGSYTGLRIGLATAKGYCYALGIPLMMHSRLRLMSLAAYYKHLDLYDVYISMLPARDKEYYIASYNNRSETIIEPQHILEADIEEVKNTITGKALLVADISEDAYNIFSKPDDTVVRTSVIDLEAWCRYAFEQYNCNDFVSLQYSEPFYLKSVYTHKPKDIN